jgi:prevent-host-death family protein
MPRTYSTYDAKARLSEILRQVRAGQRVGISYHGQLVAEVTPVEPGPEDLNDRLARFVKEGRIVPARAPKVAIPRIARKPGALKRFLESRD